MTVTLYKTRLNSSSRCYDKVAYDAYLQSCTSVVKELTTPVVQDTPIQVKSVEEGYEWQLYNYMTWEVNGLKYGAFIDDIRYNAITGTTTIYHTRDVWYFVLQNCEFDMHGQAIRAHVNDLEVRNGAIFGTLKNTYATPEERFNEENVVRDKIPLKEEGFRWVYIYFNNPHAYELGGGSYDEGFNQVVDPKLGGIPALPLTGMLVVGTFNPVTGICNFRPTDDTETVSELNGRIHIGDLTGEQIGAMYVTNIPPTRQATMTGTGAFTLNQQFWFLTPKSGTKIDGYPNYMAAPYTLELFEQKTISQVRSEQNFGNLVWGDTEFNIVSTYEEYLQQIVKARSSVYNPIFVDGNYMSTMQAVGTATIRYGISPDFSYHWTDMGQTNLKDLSSVCVKNAFASFKPDTVQDAWTRLNATRTSIAAKQQKVNAIMQGISTTWNSAMGVVNGNMGMGAGIERNAAKGGYAGAGSYFGGIQGIGNSFIGGIQGAHSAGFNYRMADIDEKFAERQYQNGLISSEVVTAYYIHLAGSDECLVEIIRQNDDNLKHIQTRLHRYGYATYLQLDDIYKNHRRQKFNYIQTINAEISGVPTAFADELSQMFNNGVHLWSGTVEEWEVVNYQTNLS